MLRPLRITLYQSFRTDKRKIFTACPLYCLKTKNNIKVKVKVKLSQYRPGVAQRVPGSHGSRISWQGHRMVVSCQPYAPAVFTPRKYSWYSFLLETESTPRTLCDRKDFISIKIPVTPAGIEPATFRFVAHHLNHCATAVPTKNKINNLK